MSANDIYLAISKLIAYTPPELHSRLAFSVSQEELDAVRKRLSVDDPEGYGDFVVRRVQIMGVPLVVSQ